MAEYGVFIATSSGQPFITPSSTPMALHSKYTFNSTLSGSSHVISQNIYIDTTLPLIPFVVSTRPASGTVPVSVSKQNGYIAVGAVNAVAQAFSITVYLFAIFPQPLPASRYGVAIWDATGKLILTHETKVLTDLATVGVRGGDNSGLNMNVITDGKWAVAPEPMGSAIYRIDNPQPVIYNLTYLSSCMFSGTQTQISAGPTSAGSGSLVGTTSNYNSLTIVNVSQYD